MIFEENAAMRHQRQRSSETVYLITAVPTIVVSVTHVFTRDAALVVAAKLVMLTLAVSCNARNSTMSALKYPDFDKNDKLPQNGEYVLQLACSSVPSPQSSSWSQIQLWGIQRCVCGQRNIESAQSFSGNRQ